MTPSSSWASTPEVEDGNRDGRNALFTRALGPVQAPRTAIHTGYQALIDAARGSRPAAASLARSPEPTRQDVTAMTPDTAAKLGFSGTGSSVPFAPELGARMSHDFSATRAFFGRSATEACEAMNAEAFTVGDKIAFKQSDPSKRLVAHELVHVVQQGVGLAPKRIQPRLEMTSPSDSLERQADDIAGRVVAGQSVQVSPGSDTHLARDGAVTAGLILGGIAIIQSQVNAVSGGLSYSSDQITYPSGLASPMPASSKTINKRVASFFSAGVFSNNDTSFNLHGDFSNSFENATAANRFMANVYIDLEDTTEYSKSDLSFNAKALQTAYGTAENPKIRFVCSGRFDPTGPGDCRYRFTLEVDQYGSTTVIDPKITAGSGKITPISSMFHLIV